MQSNRVLRRKASVLNNIGVAYHKMAEDSMVHGGDETEEHLRDAVERYREAIEIAKEIDYSHMQGWVSFNMGEVLAKLERIDEAREYSKEARRIYEIELNNDRGLSGVEMLDAVIELNGKNLEKSLDHIETSLELRRKLDQPRRIADALVCRGDIFSEKGEEKKGIDDYKEALEIYEEIGSRDGVEKVKKKLDGGAFLN